MMIETSENIDLLEGYGFVKKRRKGDDISTEITREGRKLVRLDEQASR